MKVTKLNTKNYKNLKKYKELYYFGNKDLLNNNALCIIGSRKSTSYGELVLSSVINNLVSTNIVSVSGFVDGIDFSVFKNSAKLNVPTIIALGYGFNFFNLNEVKKHTSDNYIKNKLLVVSQFSNDQPPSKWSFPKRDELLANLASCVLVVEAYSKSGTFYTVKEAFKQNIPVFGVPNSIYAKSSEGVYKILKGEGFKGKGKIYTSFNDLSKYLNIKTKSTKLTNKYSADETLVLSTLLGGSQHLDDIVKTTKLSAKKVTTILTKLEILSVVSKDNTGSYIKLG